MTMEQVQDAYTKYRNEHDQETPTQVTMSWNTYRDLVHYIRNDMILGVPILLSPYILEDLVYFEGVQ